MFLVLFIYLVLWIQLNCLKQLHTGLVEVTDCNVTLAESIVGLGEVGVYIESELAVLLGQVELIYLDVGNGPICVKSRLCLYKIYSKLAV